MQLFTDHVQDQYGNAISGASVLISQNGSPATIYSDNGVTPKANPLTTGSNGEYSFYAAGGTYIPTVTTSAGSLVSHAITLFDPEDLAASGGSALVGFIQSGDGAVLRTMQDKARETVSLTDFLGADPLGVGDSTTAINNWLARAGDAKLTAPAGTYKFTSAISIAAADGIIIEGAGRQKTKFLYTGATTTGDLWTIGDGTTAFEALSLDGFNIDSSTTMTSGTGLRIRKCQNGANAVRNVSFGELNTTKKLWDGIWFDNVNVVSYIGFEVNCQNEGVIVNGSASSSEGSDLNLDLGTVVGAKVGYHVAGGFGGAYFGAVLAFGCETSFLIDTARVARLNREIIFSDRAVSDACKNYGLHINDALASGSNCTISAFIGSAGLSGSGGVGRNIYIQSYPNSRVTIDSGQIFNATSHGIAVDDATTLVTIASHTQITNNGGWAVFANAVTSKIIFNGYAENNTSGTLSPNVLNPSWIGASAPVTAQTGTLGAATSTFKYKLVGGVCHYMGDISISNNGTAADALYVALPITPKGYANAYGVEGAIIGKGVVGFANASPSLRLSLADGAYPGGTGALIVYSGSYDYQ
jgi:hypothetical protein